MDDSTHEATPAPISDDSLRVLAEWLPRLASPDLDFGHWVISDPDQDGVTQMPWYDYSPDALRFMAEVSGAGFVQPFDWMSWMATSEAKALTADPNRVATVDAEDLRRLLTAIIRGDRFVEGNVVGAFESGVLLAIARRAEGLLD
jgi:hypothetical protein